MNEPNERHGDVATKAKPSKRSDQSGQTVRPSDKASRHAWFHCFSGMSGDMALGSLLDAGADLDEVRKLIERVPLPGWSLEVHQVSRGGLACKRAIVDVSDDAIVRTHGHIVGLILEARLPPRVASRALSVFEALAQVEGNLHGMSPGLVHFHEVGGHDAIVDIVGTASALEVLDVQTISASPIATGVGTVMSAHGLLPVPGPAVVRLLEDAPLVGLDTPFELVTPTGAAMLSAWAEQFGPPPLMRIDSSGFGAGQRELEEQPNCVHVVIGTSPDEAADHQGGQPIMTLEVNVDDVTGEQLAYAAQSLLAEGAFDTWITPIVMKKGRPGSSLHVLCDPVDAPRLREMMRTMTGSFGVRAVVGSRWPLDRAEHVVQVQGVAVRMKVATNRAKPEYEDLVTLCEKRGMSLSEAASLAEEAWRARRPQPNSEDA